MMTLTKRELIEDLCVRFLLSRKDAQQMVDGCFQNLAQALEQEEIVKITHWGRFMVKNKVARPGRNLRTGEPMTVSARRIVSFCASSRVKTRIVDHKKIKSDTL